MRHLFILSLAAGVLSLARGAEAQAQSPPALRICLAPATVEASADAAGAVEAVRGTFTTLLTGPSISSQALQSRLASQVREEARQAGCPFLLTTTLKVVNKRSGGGVLGQVAAGAIRQGAFEAGMASGNAAGRIAGSAVSTGMSQAALNYAVSIRNRDELTLGWRLETADGKVLLNAKDSRRASADGEDLLTPLAQKASEQVVEAAKRGAP